MPNDTSLSTSLAPPLPTAYLRRSTLRPFAPTFPHTAPPYYTYIYYLLCIDTNTLHYSPSLLYLYIVSSASTQTPYIILILAPMHYLY